MLKEFITPSEVIEYSYCPRFIYFMNVLKIKQQEQKRTLVQKGRHIHDVKMVQNKEYLRKKIGCTDKQIDVYLTSSQLRLVGRVDEVLFFPQGAAPLDYKYTYWEGKIYETLKMQQTLYAMLIEETYQTTVECAYLVYVRSKNHLEKLTISKQMKQQAQKATQEIFDIIDKNFYPKATKYKSRCLDCTYRNICTK